MHTLKVKQPEKANLAKKKLFKTATTFCHILLFLFIDY